MGIKKCTKCELEKHFTDFYKNKNFKDGLSYACKQCDINRSKEYRRNNREKILELGKKWKENNKEYVEIYGRIYRKENRDKKIQYLRIYRNNPENKYNKENSRIFERYGITLEQYSLMLENQNNVCAICKSKEIAKDNRSGNTRRLAVDHCHNSRKVRGLLCTSCNTALGSAKDNIEILKNMIAYLGGINE